MFPMQKKTKSVLLKYLIMHLKESLAKNEVWLFLSFKMKIWWHHSIYAYQKPILISI